MWPWGLLPFPRFTPLLLVGAILWSLLAPSTIAYVAAGLLAALLIAGTTIPCSRILVRVQRRQPERRAALTFDDGPDPELTPAILDLLRREGIRATFFLVGRKVEAHPDLARRIVTEGHRVGNHSWDHRWWHNFRSGASLRADLARASDMIERICEVRPRHYRPPYGLVNPSTHGAVGALELRVVGWSVRGCDNGNRRVPGLARRVLGSVSPGDIILLHDALPPGGSAEGVLEEVETLLVGLRERELLPDDRPT